MVAILFLIVSSFFNVAKCQSYEIGISKGDVFSYAMANTFYIDNQSDFHYKNETWNEQYVVGDFSSDHILHMGLTRSYPNGTTKVYPVSALIENNWTGGYSLIILPRNLSVGSSFPYSYGTYFVNETVLKSYQGGTRETNVARVNSSAIGYHPRYLEIQFDKTTGVVVGWYQENDDFIYPSSSERVKYTKVTSFNLTSSPFWTIPEFPSVLLPSLFMTVTVIGTLLYKKRQLRPL